MSRERTASERPVDGAPAKAAAVLTALLLPAVPLVLGLAVLLAVVARTPAGHLLGVAFTLLAPSVLLAPFVLTRPSRRVGWAALVPLAGVILYGAAAASVPPAPPPFSVRPGLQSVWLTPPRLSPVHLAVVTPEVDQLVLASWVVPPLDPLLDAGESAAFRDATIDLYEEVGRQWRVPSVQGLAYRELLGGGTADRHLYVDLPPGAGPFKVLVLLHGFGGNPQGFLWTLRRAAHAHGYAVVAPSYGAGLWMSDPDGEVVRDTLAWMRTAGVFDLDHVVLAALSNGGYGLGPAVLRSGGNVRGVAWLSAVPVADDVVAIGRLGVPCLVLHGGAEDRIPLAEAEATAALLREGGAPVDLDVVAGADHFLLVTHRERVHAALDRWLATVDAGP